MNQKTKMNEKGFNLFTPLVGTAVIIISILISITMIQNSINISEGVSKSYTVSQQAVQSQIIETSASVKMIESAEKGWLPTAISSDEGGGISVRCQEKEECINKIEEEIDDLHVSGYDGTDLHTSIEERLRVLGYKVDMYRPCNETTDLEPDNPWNPEQCVEEAADLPFGERIVITNYSTSEGRINASTEIKDIMYDYGREEAFHFKLTHELENITISKITIPRDTTYTSSKIGIPVNTTAQIFGENITGGIKDILEQESYVTMDDYCDSGYNENEDVTFNIEDQQEKEFEIDCRANVICEDNDCGILDFGNDCGTNCSDPYCPDIENAEKIEEESECIESYVEQNCTCSWGSCSPTNAECGTTGTCKYECDQGHIYDQNEGKCVEPNTLCSPTIENIADNHLDCDDIKDEAIEIFNQKNTDPEETGINDITDSNSISLRPWAEGGHTGGGISIGNYTVEEVTISNGDIEIDLEENEVNARINIEWQTVEAKGLNLVYRTENHETIEEITC